MNIFEEFVKCQNNFDYFVENCCKIHHPIKGLIPFKLYDFQKEIIKSYNENRFVIIKKFRQGGFSTLNIVYALWLAMFQEQKQILFVTNTDREAIILGRCLENIINWMPEEFKPRMGYNCDHTKEFTTTKSIILFHSAHVYRYSMNTHVFIEEADFIPDMENYWLALYPTFVNGKCFVSSSININTIKSWFESTYNGSTKKLNQFKAIATHYKQHPDYNNSDWEIEVKKNLGESIFKKEFECVFDDDPQITKKQRIIELILELRKLITE